MRFVTDVVEPVEPIAHVPAPVITKLVPLKLMLPSEIDAPRPVRLTVAVLVVMVRPVVPDVFHGVVEKPLRLKVALPMVRTLVVAEVETNDHALIVCPLRFSVPALNAMAPVPVVLIVSDPTISHDPPTPLKVIHGTVTPAVVILHPAPALLLVDTNWTASVWLPRFVNVVVAESVIAPPDASPIFK